jgi:cardiolipin synthase
MRGVPVAVENPDFAATLEGITGGTIVGGNRVDVLLNGDEIFPAYLAAIASARTTITYAQYFYEGGVVGSMVADALAQRCRGGVAVHALLDAFGAAAMPREYVDHMRAAGCEVVFSRASLLSVNHRNHSRILVVDGRVGFTGGSGVADKWLGDGRQRQQWRDTDVRLEGPVVRQLQSAFVKSWHEATRVALTGPAYFPPLAPQGAMRAQIVTSAPSKGDVAIYTMLLLAVRGARRTIHLTNPYFLPDRAMEQAIVAAVRRGVEVIALVPGPIDWTLVRAASRSGFGVLLDAGVVIYEYEPALLHAKTLVIDGAWTTIGSANLDPRSLALNAELNAVVYSAELGKRMEQIFTSDLAHARRVRFARWYARPLWRHLLEWLAAPFRSQL